MKMARIKDQIEIACKECDSLNVRRDAWAQWDVAAQSWVLGSVFDQGYCERCEGEARLIEQSAGTRAQELRGIIKEARAGGGKGLTVADLIAMREELEELETKER